MKIVIYVLGPEKVGKTAVSNILSRVGDTVGSADYHPTRGVRILEFKKNISYKSSLQEVIIELWDISGNPRFYLFIQ